MQTTPSNPSSSLEKRTRHGVRARVFAGLTACCAVNFYNPDTLAGPSVPTSVPAPADPKTTSPPPDNPSIAVGANNAVQPKPSGKELAFQAFQRGREAYSAGRYQVALEHFQDAQGLHPSPDFHYNIGQCYEGLEKIEQAVTSYRAYLRSNPSDHANIQNKIDRLSKQRDDQDTTPRPTAPHQDLERAPKSDTKRLLISGTLLTGLGAAVGVGLGIPFGLQAKDSSDQLDAVYAGNPDELSLAQASTLNDDGKRAELVQMLGIGIGSAVALTGLALLVVGAMAKKKTSSSSDSVSRLTPTFGPTGPGLSLTGRF